LTFQILIAIDDKRREQGTLNWEQIRNTHLHQFRASIKKRCFYKMRSPKKTVSLFQSHVFKHEFFLFPLNTVAEKFDNAEIAD